MSAKKAAKPAEDKPKTPKAKAKVPKTEKKGTISTSEKAKATAAKPVKSPLGKRGKAYRKVYELIDRAQAYGLSEAVELAKKTATTKFDSSVDLHVNLGVNPEQSDQIVRTGASLPKGTGKKVKVAIVKSGAEGEKLITQIEKGQIDFDILVATPDMMPKLAKAAKVLGPKGLMPNPKSGTVTPDPEKAVKEIEGGKVELRMDKQAIIHQGIGKVSFKTGDLIENAKSVVAAVQAAKPSSAKGTYILGMALATTMGPSVRLDIAKVLAESRR